MHRAAIHLICVCLALLALALAFAEEGARPANEPLLAYVTSKVSPQGLLGCLSLSVYFVFSEKVLDIGRRDCVAGSYCDLIAAHEQSGSNKHVNQFHILCPVERLTA